ncbi:MAG TPA: hypothetical protein VIE43_19515 [Thermoanaerobaculia bacterium]|nr:hypothetical protein [Thermoanaerobaculia bacterium]
MKPEAHRRPEHSGKDGRRRSPVSLSRRHRLSIYGAGLAVWISGAVWLYLQYLAAPIHTPFGQQPHPSQPVWLEIHGAAAMAALLVLGTLLTVHVPGGWTRRWSRPSGATLLGVCGLLVLTGWGLYYVGDDRWRSGLSLAHSLIGLPLPLLLVLHVTRRRKRRRGKRQGEIAAL